MTVSSAIGSRQQAVAGGLPQDIKTLGVRRGGIHKQQILADRAGEELRVLCDESNPFPQGVEVNLGAGNAVIEDSSRCRLIQSDEQFDERCLSGTRWPDERDGSTPTDFK